MPFYEYQCSSCNHHLEVLQKLSDAPLRKCPECGKQQLKRLISAPVFRLKGSGWYETDFKSDNEQKRNIAGKEEATESKPEEPKADSAKSETKTEAKSEAKPAETKSETAASKSEPKKMMRNTPVPKTAAKPAKSKAAAKPVKKKAARR